LAHVLATLSALKDWLDIPNATTTYDTRLDRVLSGVERKLEGICNRPEGWLNTTAHYEKFETIGAAAVSLRHDPVTVISAVTLVTGSGVSSTIDSGYYRLDQDESILRFYGDPLAIWTGWTTNSATLPVPPYTWAPTTTTKAYPYLQVKYIGGYASGSIPADLEQATIVIAAMEAKVQGIDPNMKAENLGNYGYTLGTPAERNAWVREQVSDYIRVGKGHFG
jgi:hypothetical protein